MLKTWFRAANTSDGVPASVKNPLLQDASLTEQDFHEQHVLVKLHYRTDGRCRKDTRWLKLWFCTIVSAALCGLAIMLNSHLQWAALADKGAFLADPANCPLLALPTPSPPTPAPPMPELASNKAGISQSHMVTLGLRLLAAHGSNTHMHLKRTAGDEPTANTATSATTDAAGTSPADKTGADEADLSSALNPVRQFVSAILHSATLLGVCGLAALAAGLVFLMLLKRHAYLVLVGTVAIQIITPAVFGIRVLATGGPWMLGVIGLGLAAALGLGFVWGRGKLHIVASLLGLASRCVSDLPGLVVVGLGADVAATVVSAAAALVVAAAGACGRALVNPVRVDPAEGVDVGECVNGAGAHVPCCTWQREPWVLPYLLLAVGAWAWTLAVVYEIKVYTVAGAVCQWYWANPPRDESDRKAPKGAVARALGFALGPSLGTCCAAALLHTMLLQLRAIWGGLCLPESWLTRNTTLHVHVPASQHASMTTATAAGLARTHSTLMVGSTGAEGVVGGAGARYGVVFSSGACLGWLSELVDGASRFALAAASMKGQSLRTASREVVRLLRRNAMDAYNVWWYPGLMLKFAATAVVAVMAAAVYAIAVAWGAHPLPFVHGGGGLGGLEGWGAAEHDLGVDMVGADAKSSGVGISVAPSAPHPDQGVPLPLAGVSAMALAVMAAGCAALVLALIAGLVGDAVDALWVCYAQDCELCTCAQPGVHQILSQLPTVGHVDLPRSESAFAFHSNPNLGALSPKMSLSRSSFGSYSFDNFTYMHLAVGLEYEAPQEPTMHPPELQVFSDTDSSDSSSDSFAYSLADERREEEQGLVMPRPQPTLFNPCV